VLWLTPLVILGVLVIAQFQKPVDPQDAVRQTTSYCLFATGLLVAIVTIILACTNLPQEIENRVIYTVATKPTTRLEIVVGKVIGFCRVSMWILIIMGLFSWGYLRFSDWRLRSAIRAQLESGEVDQISRPTLEYYRDHGTLHARELVLPTKLSVYSHEPVKDDDRWVAASGEGEILVPFILERSQFPPPVREQRSAIGPGLVSNEGDAQLVVLVRSQQLMDTKAATTVPATQPANPRMKPSVEVDFRNANFETVFTGGTWEVQPGDWRELHIPIPSEAVQKLFTDEAPRQVYVALVGMGEGYEYTTDRNYFRIDLPPKQPIFPTGEAMFTGRIGQYGQQLKGGGQRVAMFEFRDEQLPGRNSYPFEMRVGIESARNEEAVEEDYSTKITLDFYNRTNGNHTTQVLYPENNRPIYFDVGQAAVGGGKFDVVVRMKTAGWAGLRPGKMASLKLVRNDQGFAWNLIKSLTILWLMSLLVTIISIFCSTFLSWPIAVVLTMVILFGRWGMMQLGDVTDAGFGRRVAEDLMKGSNAATYRTVSETVDVLVKTMGIVSSVLPDVSQFSALEDIQQGVAVPPATLGASLQVALGFGIPLLVLAYIFLKYKEVAP
jgi:ABC-type transport system involved in multi-copper enzyme maturation permease subunit